MESKAKLLGHPIHQMMIVFPLGLLGTAAIFDAIVLGGGPNTLLVASFWMLIAGVITGLLSAVFGFVDWLAIPSKTRAKRIGAWHGIGNVIVVLLFATSWWLRRPEPVAPSHTALAFSFSAFVIALVTGWLGGELVDRLGVGVDPGAHLNSPNSLTKLPAASQDTEESKPGLKRAA